MRRYFVGVASWGLSCPRTRYVIELADDERIVGVHRGHRAVIVIASHKSYCGAMGLMPPVCPVGQIDGSDDPHSANYAEHLGVFDWTKEYCCRWPEGPNGDGVLFSLDSRAATPVVARQIGITTINDRRVPPQWKWEFPPLEDLSPGVVEREMAIEAMMAVQGLLGNDDD